jgi:hypothetical protein
MAMRYGFAFVNLWLQAPFRRSRYAGRRRARQPGRFCWRFSAAMRVWLDGNNCWLERFETETGDGGNIIVKAQFAEDALAELFRREFQGNYGGYAS